VTELALERRTSEHRSGGVTIEWRTRPVLAAALVVASACGPRATRPAGADRPFAKVALVSVAAPGVKAAELNSFRGALGRELALFPVATAEIAANLVECGTDPCLGVAAARQRANAGVRVSLARTAERTLSATVHCVSPAGHVVCGGVVVEASPPELGRAVAQLIATRGELPQVRLRQPLAVAATAGDGSSRSEARALGAAVSRELALRGITVTAADGSGAGELPRALVRLRLRDDEGLRIVEIEYVIGDGRTVERHRLGTYDAPERLAPLVVSRLVAVPEPPPAPRQPASNAEVTISALDAAGETAQAIAQAVNVLRMLLCVAALGCR